MKNMDVKLLSGWFASTETTPGGSLGVDPTRVSLLPKIPAPPVLVPVPEVSKPQGRAVGPKLTWGTEKW